MKTTKADIIVIGGGPAGYTAAFHAADLGKKVLLIDQEPQLGGACLHRGCIPSKALLHATDILSEVQLSSRRGIHFGDPKVDLNQLRNWKNGILQELSQGLKKGTQSRNIQTMTGRCLFENSTQLRVETNDGQKFVEFHHAIVAVGARPIMPKPFDLGNPRIMTSRDALDIPDIPSEFLIVGGGYIGLEMGFIYARLGSRVTILEAQESVLQGVDADLLKPVLEEANHLFRDIRVETKATQMETSGKQIKVELQTDQENGEKELFDRVLLAVGRKPHTEDLGLENTKVTLDEQGFVQTDHSFQTKDEHISAVGDCVGGFMLAHKAEHEARFAVEVICGRQGIQSRFIPSVVFTDPEIAWCGLLEDQARAQGRNFRVAKVPWTTNGRARTLGKGKGLTKLIFDEKTEQVLGIGITGKGAGDLMGEAVLALEMGATLYDLFATIHPHPTLCETLSHAAHKGLSSRNQKAG